MTGSSDKSGEVPFALPDDEDEDVLTSVEVEREEDDEDVISSSPPVSNVTGKNPAISSSGSHPSVTGKNVAVGNQDSSPSSTGPNPSVSGASVSGAQPAPTSAGGSGPHGAAGSGPHGAASSGPHRSAAGALGQLVVELPDGTEREVDVDRDVFCIGGDRAHLSLPDRFVSDWHAQLRDEDGALVIEDMNSENGVYLRIADDLQLEDHDEIVTGRQRLLFRTSWDEPRDPRNPYDAGTPSAGGDLPGNPVRLVHLYEGDVVGGVYRVKDQLSIGRQGADLVESGDPELSVLHAIIERRDGKYFIKDAASQTGTFIRIHDPVELIDGDCFLVGRSRIRVNYP